MKERKEKLEKQAIKDKETEEEEKLKLKPKKQYKYTKEEYEAAVIKI